MSSTYQVIARKWRPQTFDDVVGQDHVVRTLLDQLATAPHRQLRCEIAICLDALVEMSPRIATQMIELGGTIALADALCDALWSNQFVSRAH